jgi:cytochrome c biogenesis protein CcmG/thiol:disulfide interchange protein DsbE
MKNKFKLVIICISLIFCFIIFYKGLSNSITYIPKINDENNISFFRVKDFNSNNYTDSEIVFKEDSYYILNIWSSWCAPCRKEHPLLMELSKNQSVKLIGLNYRDDLDNAKKFINELGNPYSQILIDNDGTLSVEFGAYGVPETFLIDRNKNIIRRFIGPINKETVEEIKIIIK